jgi:hypothetical protein
MVESKSFTDNIYSLSVVKTSLVAYFTSLKIVTNTQNFLFQCFGNIFTIFYS